MIPLTECVAGTPLFFSQTFKGQASMRLKQNTPQFILLMYLRALGLFSVKCFFVCLLALLVVDVRLPLRARQPCTLF